MGPADEPVVAWEGDIITQEENNVINEEAGEETEKEEKRYCCSLVKKKTLILTWATVIISLVNFGYFSGGYYAFTHFRTNYLAQAEKTNDALLIEQGTLMSKYPSLLSNETKLDIYTKSAVMLCHITKNPRPIWSFWTAFDFCVTIITTVGYGVLKPSTWYSKLLVCCYAMAGLPLYIIMLGASGSYIVSMFEFMNEKSTIVKRVCTHKYVELIIAYINIAIVMGLFLYGYSYFGYAASRAVDDIDPATTVISLPGYNFNSTATTISVPPEIWSWTESVYYSMISLTTVGFGDYNLGKPDDPRQASMLFLSISFGFALFSYAFQTYSKASEETLKFIKEKTQAMSQTAALAVQAELNDKINLDKISLPSNPKIFENMNMSKISNKKD